MNVNLDGNTITNGYFAGIGQELTELNADTVTSGTLSDSQLSPNVALTTNANMFTEPQGILALSNLVANGL